MTDTTIGADAPRDRGCAIVRQDSDGCVSRPVTPVNASRSPLSRQEVIVVERVDRRHAAQTLRLLDELRLSLRRAVAASGCHAGE